MVVWPCSRPRNPKAKPTSFSLLFLSLSKAPTKILPAALQATASVRGRVSLSAIPQTSFSTSFNCVRSSMLLRSRMEMCPAELLETLGWGFACIDFVNLACFSTLIEVGGEIKIFTTGDTEESQRNHRGKVKEDGLGLRSLHLKLHATLEPEMDAAVKLT